MALEWGEESIYLHDFRTVSVIYRLRLLRYGLKNFFRLYRRYKKKPNVEHDNTDDKQHLTKLEPNKKGATLSCMRGK